MGEKWLAISEMEKALDNKKLLKSINNTKDHWENSAPSIYPFNQLTLFGIVVGEEENQIYLVWPKNETDEPEVWEYSGLNEHKHENLAQYLEG